jgi:hypothetical protein
MSSVRYSVWGLSVLAVASALLVSGAGCSSNSASSGSNSPPDQRLRKNIGLDLTQVRSLAVLGQGAGSQGVRTTTKFSEQPVALNPGQVVALMSNGEVAPVSLTEKPDGTPTDANQPPITAIYSTPRWILLNTMGWQFNQSTEDGGPQQLPCPTIAVHRPDGAMYCANVGLRGPSSDGLWTMVQWNASGDRVYFVSGDALNRDVLYKLQEGPDQAPQAVLMSPTLRPNWFVVNASGDVLVNTTPSGAAQGVSATHIWPVDASVPVLVTGDHNAAAIAGLRNSSSADSFYVVSGGGGGWPFDGIIRVVAKSASGFVQDNVSVTLQNSNCSLLVQLADGHYLLCDMMSSQFSLARALVDGVVQPNPKVVPLTGIGNPISVGGMGSRSGGGKFYLLSQRASDRLVTRHDGLSQQDIPLDPSLELLSMTATADGGLDLVAVDNASNTKVRMALGPTATTWTVLTAEGFSLGEAVVFTRIN